MFEPKSHMEILTALRGYYKDLYGGTLADISGTFVGDNLSATAVELEKAYAEMNLIIDAAFAQTSWGEYLTMRAAEFGVNRKMATPAKGFITVQGTGIVNIGALFATQKNIQFRCTKTVKIIDEGEVEVEAVVAGVEGNVLSGTITKIPVTIAGITSCVNKETFIGGYDTENDESLWNRLKFRVNNPITSGNANQYKEWALSVAGVGDCAIKTAVKGDMKQGEVEVIIVNDENLPANEKLVNEVQTYIDTVRPVVGATVTVSTPQYLDVMIAGTITVESTYELNYQDVIKSSINEYFKKNGFKMGMLSIAKLGKLLFDTGTINDYESLTINGDTKQLNIPIDRIPKLVGLELNKNE